MKPIGSSELVLNSDGSVYHLNLKPEHLATNVITVGDPDRVDLVASFFDKKEFETRKREFHTITGTYKGTRFTVISTGIGPDNIDIVLNELDALVNIDLEKRTVKEQLTSLNIVRIGTSGSLHADIPVDSFVMGKYGLGLDGLLYYYKSAEVRELQMEKDFLEQTGWLPEMPRPYIVANSDELTRRLESDIIYKGITATAGGFYGPQGRVLRIPLADPHMHDKLHKFRAGEYKVTNFEMETAAIYGLAKLLGHHACSMNAIIANRKTLDFTSDYHKVIKDLIAYVLDQLA